MVTDAGDLAGDWRAVYVHVEDIQEDTYAREAGGFGFYGNHFPVGRGHCDWACGDATVRVAKEVEAEDGYD